MSDQYPSLYYLCLKAAVTYCSSIKFYKQEFRLLPDNVLLDFYNKMCIEKSLCLLGFEFSNLEVFKRMLRIKHKRRELLRMFQMLIDHCSNVTGLVPNYIKHANSNSPTIEMIDFGLRLGGFLYEGGWYPSTIDTLNTVEELCKKMEVTVPLLLKLLDCYYKKIYAECYYCITKAEATMISILAVIKQLEEQNAVPNLSGVYAHFATMYFLKSEYEEAYNWSKKALRLLNEDLPNRIIIDVLRQASKSCVVKRKFIQAELLIKQAVSLGYQAYAIDIHPRYADTLMDYGFYLLNSDFIQESVKVYRRALNIRQEVFQRYNILVAIGHEDLAYAQYVNEYSSGQFYSPIENAERAMRIMEALLPRDHLLLASAKRVKALILEEIALDMREASSKTDILKESEALHQAALEISRRSFGERNVQTAKHYGNLGRLYQTMTQYKEAEQMHLKAISIKEELLGPNDYEVGLSVGHLASLYNYHMKRYQDAEKLYLRSIDISLRLFGEDYSGLEYDYRGIINVYTEMDDYDNMAVYSIKMRDWRERRETRKPFKYPKNSEKLDTVVKNFFELC